MFSFVCWIIYPFGLFYNWIVFVGLFYLFVVVVFVAKRDLHLCLVGEGLSYLQKNEERINEYTKEQSDRLFAKNEERVGEYSKDQGDQVFANNEERVNEDTKDW